MSWSETINSFISGITKWTQWSIIKKSKRFANEHSVKKILEQRAIDRANARTTKRMQDTSD